MENIWAYFLSMLNVSKQRLGSRKASRGYLDSDLSMYQHFFTSSAREELRTRAEASETELIAKPEPSQDEPSQSPNNAVPSRAEPNQISSGVEPSLEPN